MSTRPVDAAVVQRRLVLMDSQLGTLARIGSITEARLLEDDLVRYAVERILTQLVDTAVAINSHIVAALVGRTPDDYRSTFAAAAEAGALTPELAERLAPSVGLRNILIRDYTDTDLAILVASVPRALTDYRDYVSTVAQFLSRPH